MNNSLLTLVYALTLASALLSGCATTAHTGINTTFDHGVALTKGARPLDVFVEDRLGGDNRYWIYDTKDDQLLDLSTLSPAADDGSVIHPITRKIPAGTPEWVLIAEKFGIVPSSINPTTDIGDRGISEDH